MASAPELDPSFDVGEPETVGAVVVAAGSGNRMGGVDKIFFPIAGNPVLAHVLDQMEAFPPLGYISVVVGAENVETCRALIAGRGYRKIAGVCAGGARRQDSVRLGLECLSRLPAISWVIVHDGARPCLDQAVLQRGLNAARESESGAAVAGVPVKDTIKIVSPQGLVEETPNREGLWAAQTPQVFRYSLLSEAHSQWQDNVTDDAAMVEKLGHRVKMFLGSYENLKITTHEDLAIADLLLRQRFGSG